jgi:hypothetical protein
MSKQVIIAASRTKDYKRFHASGLRVSSTISREVTIEWYEDMDQVESRLIYQDDDEDVNIEKDCDYVRNYHCGITLTIDQLPGIISLLQNEVQNYRNYLESLNSGTNDEET